MEALEGAHPASHKHCQSSPTHEAHHAVPAAGGCTRFEPQHRSSNPASHVRKQDFRPFSNHSPRSARETGKLASCVDATSKRSPAASCACASRRRMLASSTGRSAGVGQPTFFVGGRELSFPCGQQRAMPSLVTAGRGQFAEMCQAARPKAQEEEKGGPAGLGNHGAIRRRIPKAKERARGFPPSTDLPP